MQPDTPRQPQADHSDTYPAPEPPVQQHRMPRGLGAGECGDAIWECGPEEGEPPQDDARQPDVTEARPGAPEGAMRGGRIIDLVERRHRRGPAGQ